MLMAMARDLRVVLIKLADRHHNLQTMAAVRADKRRRIARETLEIYAPIANRLGLNKLFRELQDLSFQLIYPLRARVLGRALKASRGNRRELLSRILEGITGRLREAGVEAGVFGREKSLYSIYQARCSTSTFRSRRCSTSTVFASSCATCPTAISRSGHCTGCTSRCRASSRTTSRSPRPTATSRCIRR
jgi:hypothetical protein